MMFFRKKFPIIIVLLLVISILLPTQTLAAEPIDLNRECILRIHFEHKGQPVEDARFFVYRVGDVSADGKVRLSGKFAGVPVDFTNLSGSNLQDIALTLDAYSKLHRIPVDSALSIRKDGYATLDGLKPGLFLVSSTRIKVGNDLILAAPLLVTIPVKETGKDSWNYAVTVSPKPGVRPDAGDKVVDRKVLKIWDDEGHEDSRPDYIEVCLMRDGQVYRTVRLNRKNNWNYAWRNLPADHEWTIMEKVPAGYWVELSTAGITTMIKNTPKDPPDVPTEPTDPTSPTSPSDPTGPSGPTDPTGPTGPSSPTDPTGPSTPTDPTGPSSPTDPTGPSNPTEPTGPGGSTDPTEPGGPFDPTGPTSPTDPTRPSNPTSPGNPGGSDTPSLPQTGMLWWPVAVLILLGVTLIIAGILLRREKRYEA